MITRAIWSDGIEVTSTPLNAESNARIFETQRRSVDGSNPGRVSGLALTLGSPATRFNVTAGYGMTPRGDYVTLQSSTSVALVDYSQGVENLVCLVYREIPGTPEPHEDGGSTRNTVSVGSSELKVLTRDEYNALPASSNADLAQDLATADTTKDYQNTCCIIASITGHGFTGSTPIVFTGSPGTEIISPSGDWVSTTPGGLPTIQQQPLLLRILTASQVAGWTTVPSSPTDTTGLSSITNISGLNIKSLTTTNLSPLLQHNYGLLRLDCTAPGGPWNLYWYGPGDALGAAVPVGVNSLPQTFEIFSSNTGMALTVEVMTSLLPTTSSGSAFYYDQVLVSAFYESAGESWSPSDLQHRGKIGSYVPTAGDPHGMGYPDLAQNVAVIPVPEILGTEMLSNKAHGAIPRSTIPASNSFMRTCLFDYGSSSKPHVRGYYNSSNGAYELTLNAQWVTGISDMWLPDQSAWGSHRFSFTPTNGGTGILNGLTGYYAASAGTAFNDAGWGTATLPIGGLITLGTLLSDTALNLSLPRIKVGRGATRTGLFTDLGVSGTLANNSIYLTSTGTGGFAGPMLEFCFNCLYDSSTTQWASVVNGPALKIALGVGGIQVLTYTSVGSEWTDSIGPWVATYVLSASAATYQGVIELGAGRTATGSSVDATTPRNRTWNAANGAPGSFLNRWLINEERLLGTSAFAYRDYVYYDTTNGLHRERAFGCTWTGSQWQADSSTPPNGAVFVIKELVTGSNIYVKNSALGSSWMDTSWDTSYPVTGTSLTLPGGTVASPAANTLYGLSIPKAWGRFTYNDSGPTLSTAFQKFNVTSITHTGSDSFVQVNFTQAFNATNYVVFAPATHQGNTNQMRAGVFTYNANYMQLKLVNPNGSDAGLTTGGTVVDISFMVFGDQ